MRSASLLTRIVTIVEEDDGFNIVTAFCRASLSLSVRAPCGRLEESSPGVPSWDNCRSSEGFRLRFRRLITPSSLECMGEVFRFRRWRGLSDKSSSEAAGLSSDTDRPSRLWIPDAEATISKLDTADLRSFSASAERSLTLDKASSSSSSSMHSGHFQFTAAAMRASWSML